MITIRSLKVGDHRFVYRTAGSGPDVLLIHGWLSSSRMWDEAMRYLAPHYRVWALDLIGFGDSRTDDPGLELTVAAHVRLIRDFCQHLSLRPYAVVGHSMGGTIAIKWALEHPDLVERLVLVCPVVTGLLHLNMGSLIGQPFTQRMLSAGERWWEAIQAMPGTQAFVAPPYLHSEAIRRSVEDYRKATWRGAFGGIVSVVNVHLEMVVHRIQVPTLVVTGSQDLTVPPADSRLAARLIPNSTLLEYSHCHHQPPDEEPEHFNRTLLHFLNGGTVQSIVVGRHSQHVNPAQSA
jgi:pimeloyl-ACP methyl ester carboxylesterase